MFNIFKICKPYLKFLPLLFIYVVIIILKHKNEFIGDEGRYWEYSIKLINGQYADLSYNEYSYLWNGPGYPIILIPFVLAGGSLFTIKLFNAVLVFVSIIFFYKTLLLLNIGKNKASITSMALGLYFPFLLQALPSILTEAISFFWLITHFLFLLKYVIYRKRTSFFLSAFSLAFLILTKVIFAYVLYVILIIYAIHYLVYKSKKSKVVLLLYTVSFLFTTPYLIYTYNLTGKPFYYANSGGKSLYWMSTPYEKEHGDWMFFETLEENTAVFENHKYFLDSIKDLSPIEKDSSLKREAISNIINHKKKYLENWIDNINRTIFGFPFNNQEALSSYSFTFRIFSNAIILTLFLFSFLIFLINIKKVKFEIIFVFFFTIIYLGGISLVSSYPRFLYPVIPLVFIFIIYTFNKFVKIEH